MRKKIAILFFLCIALAFPAAYGGPGVEARLVQASTKGETALVRKLLKAGVNPNARDKVKLTALNWAAYNGHLDIVKLLVSRGAAIDSAYNGSRWTPLMNASAQGHLDVVRYLVQHGANVNAKDSDGWTPLLYAVGGGQLQVLEFLVRGGADVNAEIPANVTVMPGATALSVAALKHHPDIFQYLLNHGADRSSLILQGVGIGEIRFGMGMDETEKILGTPDKTDYLSKDDYNDPLTHAPLLTLYFNEEGGLGSIMVAPQGGITDANGDTYYGRHVTDKGITFGSTRQDVEAVYGTDYEWDSRGPVARYIVLGLWFGFSGKKETVSTIVITKPGQRSLSK